MKREAEHSDGGTDADSVPEDKDDARPFIKMIKQAQAVFDGWQAICDDIEKLYANCEQLAATGRDRQFQIVYANLEVMKGAIYARAPRPTAVPEFETSDRVVRKAAEMLERCSTVSFRLGKVHEEVLLHCRDNLALCGRAVPWLRYYGAPRGNGFHEKLIWEWVSRKDFLHEPARCWYQVGWVARRDFLTERQGKKRFDRRGKGGQYLERRWSGISYVNADDTDPDYKFQRKAEVWQLWHKETREVIWVHLGKDEILDRRPAAEVLADLEDFFPCPCPAYGTVEPDTLKPVPDVLFYKDQVEEIYALTNRIAALTQQLKLKGFYPSGVEELGEALERMFKEEGDDRALLEGLSNFAALGGKSLQESIVWLPIKDIIEAIRACVEMRRELKDDVYEISGISDIMRGETDPNETKGAQDLKSQYGSLRIRGKQGEMIRLADDMLAMGAEVMAEQFQPATLLSMSQMKKDLPTHDQIEAQASPIRAMLSQAKMQASAAPPPGAMQPQPGGPPGAPPGPPQGGGPIQIPPEVQKAIGAAEKKLKELEETPTVEAVIGLLRAERLRPFILKVATDSTIQPDENAEKRSRTEFVTALGQLLPQLAQMVAMNPSSVGFAIALLKFLTAPFRAGRDLDAELEQFAEGVKEQAGAPKPPSPEMVKAETEKARGAVDLEGKKLDNASRQADLKSKETQAARDAEVAKAQAAADVRKTELAEAAAQREDAAAARKENHELAMANAANEKLKTELLLKDKDLELKKIDLQIAEQRLEQAKLAPKPAANGDGSNVRT